MKYLKQKLLPLTKKILVAIINNASDALLSGSEIMPRYGINKLIFGNTISFTEEKQFQQRQQLKRAIYKLKKQKYLEIKKVGDRVLYKLTTNGLHQALLARIKIQTKILPNNQYCLICFDIPESVRHLRRALRRILKNMQFKQLQKSIWYTDKDIFDQLTSCIKNLQASDWIKVALVSKIR